MDLVSISTSIEEPLDVVKDCIRSSKKGEEAYALRFEKLEEEKRFYEPTPKLKLKTFSAVKKNHCH